MVTAGFIITLIGGPANLIFYIIPSGLTTRHGRHIQHGYAAYASTLTGSWRKPTAPICTGTPWEEFLKQIDTLQHRGHGIELFADGQPAGLATIDFRIAQSECSSGYGSGSSRKLCNLHGPYLLSWNPDSQRGFEWYLDDCDVHPELERGPGSYNVSQ